MNLLPGDDVVWQGQRVRIVDADDPKLLGKNPKNPHLTLVVTVRGQLVWVMTEELRLRKAGE